MVTPRCRPRFRRSHPLAGGGTIASKEPIAIQELLAPIAGVAAFVVTYETLATSKSIIEGIGGRTSLFGMGMQKIKEILP